GVTITAVLTGDEERVGKPLSVARRDLTEAAKRSDVALEFEPGSHTDGRDFASIARRGSSGWTLRTGGVEGHSSRIFSEHSGSGAIYEQARILTAFYKELREPGLTYNVGLVLGGARLQYDADSSGGSAAGKSNIIPAETVAIGDIRAVSE